MVNGSRGRVAGVGRLRSIRKEGEAVIEDPAYKVGFQAFAGHRSQGSLSRVVTLLVDTEKRREVPFKRLLMGRGMGATRAVDPN